jgi:glycosyltransferase involved in cell wall biosynthesis
VRILFLTQTFPRFSGDTSGPFIRDLARGLARRGHEIVVLTPHVDGMLPEWEEEGVLARSFRYAPAPLEVLGYGRTLAADERMRGLALAVTPLFLAGARLALARELRHRDYDVVQAHWLIPNGPLALPAARKATFGVGLHGSDVFLAEKPLVRPLARRTLSRCRFLTGCSPELVDRVCALGFPREQARVIPYGVDVEAFRPDPGRRGLWRRRLGIPERAPVALGVGRMATKKGFQVLLAGLGRLLEAHSDLHVVLAGDGDLLPELELRAAPLGERVHFPGAVLRDSLPDLYRAADLFVLPAVHDAKGNVDGLPNVILEAMASGLPVVASGISGIPLAVRDGQEGLLVEEGNTAAVMAALSSLVDDPERRARMGAAARRRVEAELTWDAVAGRYAAAYEEALGDRADDPAAGEP